MFYDKYVPILFENICRLVQDSVVWSKDLLKKDLVTAIPNVGYEDPAAQVYLSCHCAVIILIYYLMRFRHSSLSSVTSCACSSSGTHSE